MNLNNLSAKKICRLISAGMVFSMLVITGIFGGIMQDIRIFIVGGTLTLCAFFWIWLLVLIFGKRLSHFTSNLCRTLEVIVIFTVVVPWGLICWRQKLPLRCSPNCQVCKLLP